ncbi:MAG: Mth938-like domain-containing protein [Pseudomonadota bacterium]
MKLQADRIEGSNAIARHSAEGVVVNGQTHTHSVVVAWQGGVQDWGVSRFDALTEAHFSALADRQPELVIFGTGARLRFPHPSLLRALMARGIGVESMDTPAACRTYNVLLAEGRSVVAALLFDPAP